LPGGDCTLAETADQVGIRIGAAIGDPAQADEQAVIPAHFNSITAENAMKWGSLAPTVGHYDFALADAIADFGARTGVRLRGHTLLWRDQQPADLAGQIAADADPEQRMRALVTEHFEAVLPRYRGRVAIWDVVNEPLTTLGAELDRNIFYRTLGPGYIAEAFQLAHRLDPDAALCLNEFLMTHSDTDPRTLALLELVRGLLADGVPLHAVGLQAHFHGLNLPPQRSALERTIRLFTDLGVRVELTELDVSIRYFDAEADPAARQADAFRAVAAACMAVPGCDAITLWGIHDGRTWLDYSPPFDLVAPHAPLLFDAALMPKPAYFAVRDALAARSPRELRGTLRRSVRSRPVDPQSLDRLTADCAP
jgi:endo-1,4-beta-xylanase